MSVSAIRMTHLLDATVVSGAEAMEEGGGAAGATETPEAGGGAAGTATPGTGADTGGDTTAQGDTVGHIEEVVLDPTTGQVQYAIVEADEALNVGDVWIPVPLAQLNIATGDTMGDLTVSVDSDMLANAPNFEVGALPEFGEDWDAGLREYWEVQ